MPRKLSRITWNESTKTAQIEKEYGTRIRCFGSAASGARILQPEEVLYLLTTGLVVPDNEDDKDKIVEHIKDIVPWTVFECYTWLIDNQFIVRRLGDGWHANSMPQPTYFPSDKWKARIPSAGENDSLSRTPLFGVWCGVPASEKLPSGSFDAIVLAFRYVTSVKPLTMLTKCAPSTMF